MRWCAECYTPPKEIQFFHQKGRDESGVAWGRPCDEKRHLSARPGDHLVCPFECETCVVRNLLGRNPCKSDTMLMCCIRQANLDAFWGRASGTVDSAMRAISLTVLMLKQVGVPPPFPAIGPFPLKDNMGHAVAIAMLLKSREAGRNCPDRQQFDTIRKLRMGYSNIYQITPTGVASLRAVSSDKSKAILSDCVTNGIWFERFARGCLSRMGEVTRQDRAISLKLMHKLMAHFDAEWTNAPSAEQHHQAASYGAYSIIAFCGSFRGAEVFLTDLHGLRNYYENAEALDDDEVDHVVIPLLGTLKNEHGLRYHLTPLASKTHSGLEVKKWVGRLLDARAAEGRFHGPAFGDPQGRVDKTSVYEGAILDRLAAIQRKFPKLFGKDTDVYEEYGISRSFRRGATSEARARGVHPDDVDMANRWRNVENSKGRKPRLKMRDHYSDIRLMVPMLIRFSAAL